MAKDISSDRYLRDMIASSIPLKTAIVEEGVDQDALVSEASSVAQSIGYDIAAELRALGDLELSSSRERLFGALFVVFGWLALLLIAAVPVIITLKLLGKIESLTVIPLTLGIPIIGGTSMAFLGFKQDFQKTTEAATAKDRQVKSDLTQLVLSPALDRLTALRLITTAAQATFGRPPVLPSRIDATSRLETSAYRQVYAFLRQPGGASVGLAGPRGVGKSELLRAFCAQHRELSIDGTRTLGVLVPAPVAFDSEAFLRLLLTRVAQAVPGYHSGRAMPRIRWLAPLGAVSTSVGVSCIGFGIYFHFSKSYQRGVAFALFVVAALPVVAVCAGRIYEVVAAREGRRVISYGRFAGLGASPRTAAEVNVPSSLARRRVGVAHEASSIEQRMYFMETRTLQGEGGTSLGRAAIKLSLGKSLAQIPWTAPALANELERFVSLLRDARYSVVIGIDELDKLGSSEEAARFLNGMKLLFPIKGCSFLLSLSDNAADQFARRGMPIRDTFDSALDTVVTVPPLTFIEARRMIRRRATVLSDAEILFCHCVAGGLPRELLRVARQLLAECGRPDADASLIAAFGRVLNEEASARVNATVSHIRNMGMTKAAMEVGMASADLAESITHAEAALQITGLARGLATFTIIAGFGDGRTRSSQLPDEVDVTFAELLSYLYFLTTVYSAFAPTESDDSRSSPEESVRSALDDPIVVRYSALAAARRALEADPVKGWLATDVARVDLNQEVRRALWGGLGLTITTRD